MENNTLNHWGIKGMKWGVRRYQNKDGSLTPAGEKRYSRDIQENNSKKKDNRINIDGPDPSRWVKEDIRRAKDVTDSSNSMVREFKNVNNSMGSKSKKQTLDLSKMTDQEMRSQINRTLLERQYNDMFAPQKTSRGKEYVGKVLEVAGTALSVTGTALSIALAIKELNG
jgi:hypothetical protein